MRYFASGSPKDVFPPTDFHSATLVANTLYLIGSAGYQDLRRYGHTQVYRLDTESFKIEELVTAGTTPADGPGWISRHEAEYDRRENTIRIFGGKVENHKNDYQVNTASFDLDLTSGLWKRAQEQ